jgi:hypothetical protein
MFKQENVANAMRKVMSRDFVIGSASTDRIALDAPSPATDSMSLSPASVAFAIEAAEAAAEPTLTAQLSAAPSLSALMTQLKTIPADQLLDIDVEKALYSAIRRSALKIPGAADSFVKVTAHARA